MKVYSWNMLFTNRKVDRAIEFIRELEYDAFCLQEVTEETLAELKKLPVSIAYCQDVRKWFRSGTVSTYNVTLTPHPIEKRAVIHFPDYWPHFALHTKLFIQVLRPFKWSRENGRGALLTDIRIGNRTVRTFNLHLILARPQWRISEFEAAMLERDRALPTVVCGDFNVIESLWASSLNLVFGGRLSDVVFFRRERVEIEKRFISHELVNVLRGKRTHPISRSQLDHILVSHGLEVEQAAVFPKRLGSDHHPILATIALDS